MSINIIKSAKKFGNDSNGSLYVGHMISVSRFAIKIAETCIHEFFLNESSVLRLKIASVTCSYTQYNIILGIILNTWYNTWYYKFNSSNWEFIFPLGIYFYIALSQ